MGKSREESGRGERGQDGCEPRIVNMKMRKSPGGRSGWGPGRGGVRMDVNQELKLL